MEQPYQLTIQNVCMAKCDFISIVVCSRGMPAYCNSNTAVSVVHAMIHFIREYEVSWMCADVFNHAWGVCGLVNGSREIKILIPLNMSKMEKCEV